MDIVDRVKELAAKRNLTIQEIGQITGLGATAIYKWNNSKPNVYNVAKVAKLLDVTVEYLVFGNDTNKCS